MIAHMILRRRSQVLRFQQYGLKTLKMEVFLLIHILLSLHTIVCDSRLSIGVGEASIDLIPTRVRGKSSFFSSFTSGNGDDSVNDGNDGRALSRARALEEFPEYSHKELNLVDAPSSKPATAPPFQWNSDKDLEVESINSINDIVENAREARSSPLLSGEEDVGESVEENSSRMGPGESKEESKEDYEPEEYSVSWLLSQDVWDKVESGEDYDESDGISDESEGSDEASDEEGKKPGDSVLMEKLLRFARETEDRRFKRDVKVEGDLAHPDNGGSEYDGEDKKAVGHGVRGKIEVSFVPPANTPHALITIKSESNMPLAAEAPPVAKVHPPLYFCGVKTNPNLSDPDSPYSEVFETSRVD